MLFSIFKNRGYKKSLNIELTILTIFKWSMFTSSCNTSPELYHHAKPKPVRVRRQRRPAPAVSLHVVHSLIRLNCLYRLLAPCCPHLPAFAQCFHNLRCSRITFTVLPCSHTTYTIILKIKKKIYFLLAALGFWRCVRPSSSCSKRGPLFGCRAEASHCIGFSFYGAQALECGLL